MLFCPSPQSTCMNFIAKFHVRHYVRHTSDNKNTVREDETEILQEIERKVLPLLDVKDKTKKRI